MRALLLLVCFSNFAFALNKAVSYEYENLYRAAQRNFSQQKYQASLELFNQYIEKIKSVSYHKPRLFWAIDHVARIHLRVNKDPEAAIQFFNSFEKDKRLDEEKFDIIQEWRSVAKDWKKAQSSPEKEKDPKRLFELGQKYYLKGLKKAEEKGDADLAIASAYLSQLIFVQPDAPQTPEALFMLGDIKSRLHTDDDYWAENFYLKELIQRVPNSDLAWRAWQKLNLDIRQGYTGSSGENTPVPIVRMLKRYEKMAMPKKNKNKRHL